MLVDVPPLRFPPVHKVKVAVDAEHELGKETENLKHRANQMSGLLTARDAVVSFCSPYTRLDP